MTIEKIKCRSGIIKMLTQKHSIEERRKQFISMNRIHPDRVPVIVVLGESAKHYTLSKTKFLVKKTLTVGQFLHVLRMSVGSTPEEAFFIFVGNTLPLLSSTMGSVSERHRKPCGFLFVTLNCQDTFGF